MARTSSAPQSGKGHGPIVAQTPTQALAMALAIGRAALGDDRERDARALLAHAAGITPSRLMMLDVEAFDAALMQCYADALSRRSLGEPVSKITGKRAFWNHDFIVTADVLDPRPDTETLVAKALERPFERILDLGTGSGCILLSLLAERGEAQGVGVDLSEPALDVARANAAAIGVVDRVQWLHGDWFDAVTGRFDLIVSNPPYIAAEEMAELDREVRDHDPAMALTPGGDGLDPYRIIAAQAGSYLHPNGRLIVEMGWQQGPQVAAILSASGWRDVAIWPDLEGRDRAVSATAP
ncbi:peptide chain release factor N(5)-glutamine methyltransferase [Litorivita pollutaquae]|nr:peptide chain release factor N(5)-glutamine methyltransferase [Litorivita pollutaquae]